MKGPDVNFEQWSKATEREGRRLAEVAEPDLDADVTSCPGWTMARLVGHLGAVHRLAAHAVATGSPPEQRSQAPGADDVLDWYNEGLDALLQLFATADPEAPAWNWSTAAPDIAGFWWRRMAQETVIHRWDGEGAVTEGQPIDAVLASDGIDEWFDVFLRRRVGQGDVATDGSAGSMHVHCSDVDGEWWAELKAGDVVLERAHRKGDVVLRGGASDLVLVLWGRLPADSVEIFGNADLIPTWVN